MKSSLLKTSIHRSALALVMISATVATLWSTNPPSILSSGAPASSTGAPGEKSCSQSGCHDDTQPNIGPASYSINFSNGSQSYLPDSTYTIRLRVEDVQRHRFGFQLVVLDTANKNVGFFTLKENERTQVLENFNDLTDRRYATYTYAGTAEKTAGVGEWQLQWTAPSVSVGPIHFYAAFAAANNDKSDKGDHIYTMQKQLTPLSSACISIVEDPSLLVSPNPVLSSLQLWRLGCFAEIRELQILDNSGRSVQTISAGSPIPTVLDCQTLSPGRYELLIRTEGRQERVGFVKQ